MATVSRRNFFARFILRNSASPDKRLIETMVSGVALFDYNNDGWLDIFFVNGAAIPQLEKTNPAYHNRLYRNDRGKGLTDVTGSAGVSGTGNQLLHNDGGCKFSDVTRQAGVEGLVPGYGKGWGQSAGWFDYDNDAIWTCWS